MIIVTKKVNKHICLLFCASLAAYIPNVTFSVPLLLLIYPMSLSAEFLLLIPNHHKVVQVCQNWTSDVPCLPYIPVEKFYEKMDRNK